MATKQAVEAYRTALMRAMQDGHIDPSEQNILNGLRESLGISPEEHVQIERWVRKEIAFRMQQRSAAPQNLPPPPQPPNAPQPPPPPSQPQRPPPPQPMQPQPGQQGYQSPQQRQVRRPVQKKAPPGQAVKKATKAKTGAKRLDDILTGGIPFKSNVMVLGPSFIGKENFLNQFVITGLAAGIPCMMVITDRTSTDARKGLLQMSGELASYEQKGLIKYVDAHSLSVGMIGKNPNARYVKGCSDVEALKTAMAHFQGGFKQSFFYHRVVVTNLSTLLRCHDLNTVINFLQTTNARNKAYNSICLYDLSAGVHQPNEIMSIKNTMDGSMEFKQEEGKNYCVIQGLEEVKNRDWLEYEFTNQDFDVKGGFGFQYIS